MALSTRTAKELQKVGNYRICEAIYEVGELGDLGEKLLYFTRNYFKGAREQLFISGNPFFRCHKFDFLISQILFFDIINTIL